MSKPIVIFEGLNCVGKSSLIKTLHEGEDIYVHNNRASFLTVNMADAVYGYTKALIDILRFSKVPMWFDRFHCTEYAYGIVNRKYNEHNAKSMFDEHDFILSKMGNVRLVYLYDDIEEICKRTRKLRHWGDIETMQKLNKYMERCVDDSQLPMMIINYKELIESNACMNKLSAFVKGEEACNQE